MGEKLKEILKDGALAADIDLTDSQLDKFEKFYEYLIEKNKVMNLTPLLMREMWFISILLTVLP